MTLNPLDWFKPVEQVIGTFGEAVDSIVTSDEERLTLRNKLAELNGKLQMKLAEYEAMYEKQLTERWKSDNESDSVLAKNVRPASLIFLLFVITALALMDGNIEGFSIKIQYIELFALLATTAFFTYFSSRGYEKGKGKVK